MSIPKLFVSALFYIGLVETLILSVGIVESIFDDTPKEASDGVAWLFSVMVLIFLMGSVVFSYFTMNGRFYKMNRALLYPIMGLILMIEFLPIFYILFIIILSFFFHKN